jgi:hypothetical protein
MTIWSTYFTAIGNILWPFGTFCDNLVHFPRFGIWDLEKSGNLVSRLFFSTVKNVSDFCGLGQKRMVYIIESVQ